MCSKNPRQKSQGSYDLALDVMQSYFHCILLVIHGQANFSVAEEGMGSYFIMRTEFHLCKMKSVLEMDGGDGCTTI